MSAPQPPTTVITDARPRPAAALWGMIRDAWTNLRLGFGSATHDPSTSTYFSAARNLTPVELDALYGGSSTARKIIDLPSDEEVRRPPQIEGLPDDVVKPLDDETYRLDVYGKVAEARSWARLYGGAAIIVRVEGDDQLLSTPLDRRKIRRITSLETADRYSLTPDPARPRAPRSYLWTTLDGMTRTVHASRVIRFEGLRAAPRSVDATAGWGVSVMDLCHEELSRVGLTEAGIGRLSADFARVVLTVPGLLDQISGNGEAAVDTRYALMRTTQSILRMTVLDGQEKIETQAAPISGLADLVDQVRGALAAAADIPVVRLWGVSPGGMNATGETDERFWYDRVGQNQETFLRRPLTALMDLVMSAQLWGVETSPTLNPLPGRTSPAGWRVTFPPLHTPSEAERAQIRLTTAQADAAEIQSGVLDPDEVAVTRYGSGVYDTGAVQIDLETRAQGEPGAEEDLDG